MTSVCLDVCCLTLLICCCLSRVSVLDWQLLVCVTEHSEAVELASKNMLLSTDRSITTRGTVTTWANLHNWTLLLPRRQVKTFYISLFQAVEYCWSIHVYVLVDVFRRLISIFSDKFAFDISNSIDELSSSQLHALLEINREQFLQLIIT